MYISIYIYTCIQHQLADRIRASRAGKDHWACAKKINTVSPMHPHYIPIASPVHSRFIEGTAWCGSSFSAGRRSLSGEAAGGSVSCSARRRATWSAYLGTIPRPPQKMVGLKTQENPWENRWSTMVSRGFTGTWFNRFNVIQKGLTILKWSRYSQLMRY